ncbi:MAG: hypothetical protein J6N76_05845, partial [Lachnospiraceae bacterium]|nr:hypothetical protein [Lachnospiraceae bacterium]
VYFHRDPAFSMVCMVAGGLLLLSVIIFAIKNQRMRWAESRRLTNERERAEAQLDGKKRERKETVAKIMGFLKGYLVTPTDSFAQMVSEIKTKTELYHRLLAAEEQYLNDTRESTERLSELAVRFHTSLSYYVDAYGTYSYEELDEIEVIERLDADVASYAEIRENLKIIEDEEEKLSALKKKLDDFVGHYPPVYDKDGEAYEYIDYGAVMKLIRQNAAKYAELSEKNEALRREIELFEEENDINEESQSVEVLQERLKELDERVSEQRQQLNKEQERLSNYSDEIEGLEELAENIEDLKADEASLMKEARLLEKTAEYLRKARERFLARYMGPLRNGLRKYLRMIMPDEATEEYDLDMNLAVKVHRMGATWDSEYLSAGYQDMVALCARMALIDVLYTEEYPPVILDDPFTNLDTDKTKRAIELVRSLADDRQIIYLTCSDSRVG